MIKYMGDNPSADAGEIFELLHDIVKYCHLAEKNIKKLEDIAQSDKKLAKELEEIHEMVTGRSREDD